MEQLFQQLWEGFLRIGEHVVDYLESGQDYQAFQQRLRGDLDSLGQKVLKSVIEASDLRLRESTSERQGWVIAQRGHEKELLTQFGPVRFQRTYFKHKQSKRHAYLVDEAMGFTPHQRVDVALKAELVDRAAEQSFRRSGRWSDNPGWQVSGQTVMKASRTINAHVQMPATASGESKRRLRYVFIQADEDHVANQDGPRWQPRLVTVHEGVEGTPKRRRLKNPKRFGGLYPRGSNDQLYEAVWQYLDATYDLEHVEKILVSGDGASWIRGLCEYIPGSVFVLDRYHAHQYATSATGTHADLSSALRRAFHDADRPAMRKAMHAALDRAESESQYERISECHRYFERQWDGIKAWRTYGDVWPGCSAEGDVSHIYADRMSSRPMAWRRQGVDQMSRLRVMRVNGNCIRKAYVDQQSQGLAPVRVAHQYMQEARLALKTNQNLSHVVKGRMPALYGPKRGLHRILAGFNK